MVVVLLAFQSILSISILFFGNDTLLELNHSFRKIIQNNNLLINFLAISHDGCGNYILIEEANDNLYLYNHETQSIEKFYGGNLSEVIDDFISGA